jgi:hypothetical protein
MERGSLLPLWGGLGGLKYFHSSQGSKLPHSILSTERWKDH